MFIRSFKHLLLDLSVYAKSLLNGRTRKISKTIDVSVLIYVSGSEIFAGMAARTKKLCVCK